MTRIRILKFLTGIYIAFTQGVALAYNGTSTGALGVGDITGVNSNTNGVTFIQTLAKWIGIGACGVSATIGTILIIKGAMKMAKSGGKHEQDAKGAIMELLFGAILVAIPVAIGIIAYTMTDAGNSTAAAPSM